MPRCCAAIRPFESKPVRLRATRSRPFLAELKSLADSVGDGLVAVQSQFKKELLRNVKQFVGDVLAFRNDWEAHGPTVPGITPMQGHERLQVGDGRSNSRP